MAKGNIFVLHAVDGRGVANGYTVPVKALARLSPVALGEHLARGCHVCPQTVGCGRKVNSDLLGLGSVPSVAVPVLTVLAGDRHRLEFRVLARHPLCRMVAVVAVVVSGCE
jgi:hypothetical protein